jgi:6-phosphogluconolactonase
MDTLIKNNELNVFRNAHDLFDFAAKDFMQRALSAVRQKGFFSVVLSGGNTPKNFFDILTDDFFKKNIPWQQIKFFFGDERYVPADDTRSNFYMTSEHLFSKLDIKKENIYSIITTFDDPLAAADSYEQTLRNEFNISKKEFPPFDLVYLGLGDNAHTASLMPFSDVVKRYAENQKADNDLVAALYVPELKMYRITLTPPAINHALNVIFLVSGEDKSAAVAQVLQGHHDALRYPAQLIACQHNKTLWYLDDSAASKLNLHQS